MRYLRSAVDQESYAQVAASSQKNQSARALCWLVSETSMWSHYDGWERCSAEHRRGLQLVPPRTCWLVTYRQSNSCRIPLSDAGRPAHNLTPFEGAYDGLRKI